jgi:hypothetical protein
MLREKGIIDYHRGVLSIRNPKRLHKLACECFDAVSWATHAPASPPPSGAAATR